MSAIEAAARGLDQLANGWLCMLSPVPRRTSSQAKLLDRPHTSSGASSASSRYGIPCGTTVATMERSRAS